jgi:hypothetical protein
MVPLTRLKYGQNNNKNKSKEYHIVGTVPQYHTVGTVPQYHTVGTVPQYHTVGTIPKYNKKNCKKRQNRHLYHTTIHD